MSGQNPPLTCAEVKDVLDSFGFRKRAPTSGISHESWVKVVNNRLFKVMVDCPKALFSPFLIKSMAKQAGLSKRQSFDRHFQLKTGIVKEEVSNTTSEKKTDQPSPITRFLFPKLRRTHDGRRSR